MNDHKDLIGDIGDCLIAQPSEAVCKRVLREAANAIEQLVKERDAAIADLYAEAEYYGDSCYFCSKNNNTPCRKCNWEWRGVQEEEHEAN